jgi:hypothetical protein
MGEINRLINFRPQRDIHECCGFANVSLELILPGLNPSVLQFIATPSRSKNTIKFQSYINNHLTLLALRAIIDAQLHVGGFC